ncbi:hypothetical protein KC318_g31 [Hortaea werneckii]|nr:hypothetical protein KC334_g29 [Hortaea werneckii]KAI7028363.1 hypothetical protein KC355_g32 [Hortaea werneckii]KAI7676816.1 hypothetical protein KC318_g31 [Hortaea werneckii]
MNISFVVSVGHASSNENQRVKPPTYWYRNRLVGSKEKEYNDFDCFPVFRNRRISAGIERDADRYIKGHRFCSQVPPSLHIYIIHNMGKREMRSASRGLEVDKVLRGRRFVL